MILSIIILNYDTRDLLKQCLDSIPESSPAFPLEVLIINNGSQTDTAESLSGLHPQGRVYDLPVNVGFGQANNLGVQEATGEYVLLLNSDTYFLQNSLARMVEFVRSKPDIDIFGCQVLHPDGSQDPQYHNCQPKNRVRTVFSYVFKMNAVVAKAQRGLLNSPNPDRPIPPYWLTGCCIFVKRRVYEQSRGFDPDFYLYYEETEWFYNRIFNHGYRIEICDDIKVVHLGGASQTVESRNSQSTLSSFLFYYKLGWAPFVIGWLTALFNIVTRMACVPFVPSFFWQNLQIIKEETLLLIHVLRDIPGYPRHYAGRTAPLMTRSNQQRYSWSQMSRSMLKGMDEFSGTRA